MRIASMLAVACAAAALAISIPANAASTAQQGTMKSCASTWSAMTATDKAKTKYKDYMSTCMKAPASSAMAAPAPAMKAAPAMAMKPAPAMAMKASTGGGSAKCKDGKVVTYKNRMGTCSGHGGVATWM